MKWVVLYDDEIETDQEGVHFQWECFQKLLEEIIWKIIRTEVPADQKKDQI